MAKEKEYNFICEDCKEEFIIITESKVEPDLCPFCGGAFLADPDTYEREESDEE